MYSPIIISGPPCSGKTHLINKIIKHPYLFSELICNKLHFTILNANQIRQDTSLFKTNNNLIVHYDCFRNYKRGLPYTASSDVFLELLASTSNLKIIFLTNSSETLIARINDRIDRLKPKISEERLCKLHKLQTLYSDPLKTNSEYLKWFNYCSTLKKAELFSLPSYSNCFKKLKPYSLNPSLVF